MAVQYMPQCVSDHAVGDAVCDGDPEGATLHDRTPCAIRDKCLSLQLHLMERRETVEQHVNYVAVMEGGREVTKAVAKVPGKFTALIDLAKKRYGVKGGTATKQPKNGVELPKKQRKPTKNAMRRAHAALQKNARARNATLHELFEHFKLQLKSHLPHKLSKRGHTVSPGNLYVVDRSAKSHYLSIYCRTQSGRDIPVVLAKFKPRTMSLDVELPVTPEVLADAVGKLTYKKLAPKHLGDGRFVSILPNLDREALGLAAEAIGRLVGSGIITLPAA